VGLAATALKLPPEVRSHAGKIIIAVAESDHAIGTDNPG
jgi:hypothetical protein